MPRKGKREFGAVRQLASGRWQVRYLTQLGEQMSGPTTFASRAEASRYLDLVRSDIEKGDWIDPRAGRVTLEEYAWDWLAYRPDLRPRTQELYDGLLRLHVLPQLGRLELAELATPVVRVWHAELLRAPRPGASTAAKAYRLLRGILNTAVADSLIARNPCVIPGAGIERPAERPTADIAEVVALADALGLTFRAMVFVATFCGLRLGEMQALRWEHIDFVERTIRVVEQTLVLKSGKTISGPPKTEAGVRTIAVPPVVLDELEAHRGRSAHAGRSDLVFGRLDGRPLRRATFYKHWRRAVADLGLGDFHLHDLRHTGNTLAAATGASTKELMTRMGHASPRAALIYQHATRKRDQEIADGLQRLVDGASGCSTDADPSLLSGPEVQAPVDEPDDCGEVG